jgi:hypothetical protein
MRSGSGRSATRSAARSGSRGDGAPPRTTRAAQHPRPCRSPSRRREGPDGRRCGDDPVPDVRADAERALSRPRTGRSTRRRQKSHSVASACRRTADGRPLRGRDRAVGALCPEHERATLIEPQEPSSPSESARPFLFLGISLLGESLHLDGLVVDDVPAPVPMASPGDIERRCVRRRTSGSRRMGRRVEAPGSQQDGCEREPRAHGTDDRRDRAARLGAAASGRLWYRVVDHPGTPASSASLDSLRMLPPCSTARKGSRRNDGGHRHR